MIHGYKKQKKQKSQQEAREEEALSIKINEKLGQFFAIPRDNVNPQQIPKYLQFIALLMQIVSDIPTVFNFRRQLVQKAIKVANPEQIGKLLGGEVKLTTKLIQSDPKSYTIWSYRQWLIISLFKINKQVIKKEKELIQMLLTKDEKNFHVWNYRNWLNSIQSFIDEEINFTTEKIKSNPFNFSPYHFRTKFIHQKYSELLKSDISEDERKQIVTFGMPKNIFMDEIEIVTKAIFMNPNEEAPWSYYNWLLGQLVPAFVVASEKKVGSQELLINMKVSNFSQLVQAQNMVLQGKSGKLQSQKWELKLSSPDVKIHSNLSRKVDVKLQSTGRLFLGLEPDSIWIKDNIKQNFQKALQFLDEVIQSEEGQQKCRFVFLQKATIYKYILQCGTSEEEFTQTVQKGLETIKNIEKESKANKYIVKQTEYWSRLQNNDLTPLERSLKSKYM